MSEIAPRIAAVSLLLVAFSRWRIERMFEDSGTGPGMDPSEAREYLSLQRRPALACVSRLFPAEFCLAQAKKIRS